VLLAARRDLTLPRGEADAEWYSRQVYAVGARAHGLVRRATAVLDGPLGGRRGAGGDGAGRATPSGLLYEVAKNLALSGVGRLVLVEEDGGEGGGAGAGYFDGALDDLGAAYRRAALAEVGTDAGEEESDGEDAGGSARDDGARLLGEYRGRRWGRRLQPGVGRRRARRGENRINIITLKLTLNYIITGT
jgi:hypothetical protein